MIYKYYQFINESKQNVFDELSDIIIERFENKDYLFSIEHYSKEFNKRKFKIKNLNIEFIFTKDSENRCGGICDITRSKLDNDYLLDVKIKFSINYKAIDSDFIKYIHSVIKHEIFHLYQAYNLKINNKFKPESWVIGSLIPTFRRFFKTNYVSYILDVLYISLSHEIYSQLQQYYFYKKDNLNYNKIDNIQKNLENFIIKPNLDEYEVSEISNMKKFIIKGLKDNDNKKYKNDVDKSIWNEEDLSTFLIKLKQYFKEKSDLIKSKIEKIEDEFNLDKKIEETFGEWISLPSDFENMTINDFDLVDDIIVDVFY